jgi:hypothetical protein
MAAEFVQDTHILLKAAGRIGSTDARQGIQGSYNPNPTPLRPLVAPHYRTVRVSIPPVGAINRHAAKPGQQAIFKCN